MPSELRDEVTARLRAFPSTEGEADVRVELEIGDPSVIPVPRGPRRRLFQPQYELEYFAASDSLRLGDRGAAALCDLRSSSIHIVTEGGDARATFAGSHLFFTLSLLECMKRRGRFAMHSAAVSVDGWAVLIAGSSGVGKTTLAVACALSGFDLLGDDLVLLRRDDDARSIVVRAFPDSIDLSESSREFFPELAVPMAATPATVAGKHAIDPREISARIVWEARPAVIVFPSTEHVGPAHVRSVPSDETIERLLGNIVRTETVATQRHLDILADLARTVPAFLLEVSDPWRAPTLFMALLASR